MPLLNHLATQLYWRLDGNPSLPPLVLVNSLGTDCGFWEPVMPLLQRYFQVLRMDKRGHGGSPATPGDYSISLLGEDVLAVMDAAGFSAANTAGKVNYAGVSIGGMIGQWLAAHHGQRFARMVFSNTTSTPDPQVFATRIKAVQGGGMAGIVDAVMGRFFTERFLKLGSPHVQSVRTSLLSTDPVGYAGCCAAIRDMSHEKLLANIQVPCLVIAGSHDLSTPPAHGQKLAQSIAGAQWAEFPTAHFAHSECPSAWTQAVVSFLLSGTTKSASSELPNPNEAQRYEAGLARRKANLGAGYVDDRLKTIDRFNRDFQHFITRYAWGEVWTQAGMDDRTRRLVVLGMMLAQGHWDEFELHVRAGLEAELDPSELQLVMQMAAVYCGVPTANHGYQLARKQLQATGREI